MATSESDDFESADEEMNVQAERKRTQVERIRSKRYASIGSDSDDDVDYIPVQYHTPIRGTDKEERTTPSQRKRSSIDKTSDKSGNIQVEDKKLPDSSQTIEKDLKTDINKKQDTNNKDIIECKNLTEESEMSSKETENEKPKIVTNRRERPQRQRKSKENQSLGATKLGAVKIDKLPEVEATTQNEVRKKAVTEDKQPPLIQQCWEECDEQNLQEELKQALQQQSELQDKSVKTEKDEKEPTKVPDELMSNLKFKDIFKPDGWEGLNEDVELPDDLSDDKYHPILDKLASSNKEQESTNGGWGGWGSWGVTSLLNTATASVSTLTSHVSHGLSLLEETIGVPDPIDLASTENTEEEEPKLEEKASEEPESQSFGFGFGNFISSMSSITKLVESTGTKVISGGLDTLETIGKKTMEVLQEGDPGLKKKRAFFSNDINKPILSQVLREAKEKADAEEKSIEEKQLARKVHLESLFDDYQGLVHLEALEMLSKQCNLKIQQQLINLDGNELTSMQETLDEIKDLCDLGSDDEDDEEEKDLKQKLEDACKDLGVSITYDKLINTWNELNSQISNSKDVSHKGIFQQAISALAQFTAYSVERFHKTAELLLIKAHRSTVNEADSLVQLTKTLTSQIGSIANLYCTRLKEFTDENEKSEISSNITTITLEATNASSYVQEAFRLLIPILQIGAV